MQAKSIKGKSLEEIQSALQQCMVDASLPKGVPMAPDGQGFQPTLAFVFMSIKQDYDAVSALLDASGISIFGATTAGEFIDEEIGAGSISILLLDMNRSNFKILIEDYSHKDPEELARNMAHQANDLFHHPAFILSYSVEVAAGLGLGEPIIRAIESVAGRDITIWGGGAGDDLAFIQTAVFTNGQSTNNGIILLVMDEDKIEVRGMAASGHKAVGTEKIVTKAIGNVMYAIDHQPATEMVLKYMGLKLTKEEAETFTPGIVVFSLLRDTGDPVLRSSGVFDLENKSLVINGSIKEGDKIRLTLPPDFEVIEEVRKSAAKVQQTEMPDADALLMFSCVGRLAEFGPMIGDEIQGVKNVFNVPMAGFFTYGEFGRATLGNNEFHNHTCCWVALKEK